LLGFLLLAYPFNKRTPPEDPLISKVGLSAATKGLHSLPPSMASDQPTTLQFQPPSLGGTFLHEGTIGCPSTTSSAGETAQDLLGILPWVFLRTHESGMAAPGVAVERLEGIHDTYSERIQMEVSDQL
jgi:hypothetical protein